MEELKQGGGEIAQTESVFAGGEWVSVPVLTFTSWGPPSAGPKHDISKIAASDWEEKCALPAGVASLEKTTTTTTIGAGEKRKAEDDGAAAADDDDDDGVLSPAPKKKTAAKSAKSKQGKENKPPAPVAPRRSGRSAKKLRKSLNDVEMADAEVEMVEEGVESEQEWE